MTMFALVDCNNFYASCERVFNPRLEGKPVVVLSNNDGCIIARSNEAKKLGIPMGAPFFEWEKICKKNQIAVFSSNYELYGDMSQRVMTLLTQCCPAIEIYSIDEAFLSLENLPNEDLINFARNISILIKKNTGLPVSVGIGTTKTLAKLANQLAKQQSQHNAYYLNENNMAVLKDIPIEKIWGVGKRLAIRLRSLNLQSAHDLKEADPKNLRAKFSVVMEKMIYELRGISCLSLESVQPRKQIICSRSFSKSITELAELEEAISHYTAIASAKLRKQHSLASALSVFLHTNFFRKEDLQYENSACCTFHLPTADTGYIISVAKKTLAQLFRRGYRYQKTGIILLDLVPDTRQQFDLFNQHSEKNVTLMQTVDQINQAYGKNTVFHGAEGVARAWQIKFSKRSFRYTTRWDEILKVK